MPKSAYGTRPNEFKYGMALYGAAWPPGDHYFVCGGGGHGLVPRIVWAKHHNGRCTDQVGEYRLGKETPMRMVLAPSGTALLLGNSEGGIRRFQMDLRGPVPRLVEVSAAFAERFNELREEVKCMAFSPNGRWLAVGFATGHIKVLEYPAMKVRLQWSLKDGVKDLDFMQLQPQQLLLATCCEDGSCQIWEIGVTQFRAVAQLQMPRGMDKCLFVRCRYARTGQPLLYVAINQRRDTCYLAVYGPDQQGGPWVSLKKVKVDNGPNAAMEISKAGQFLALGQTSGRLLVYDSRTLQVLKKEEEANMVFITGVAFADDDTRVMAVGADANCYVMELVQPAGGGGGFWLFVLLVLLLAAGAGVAYILATPEQKQMVAQLLQPLIKHESIQQLHQGAQQLQDQTFSWRDSSHSEL